MSLIDWSDADAMLGLLVEYVADEAVAAQGDHERSAFLDQLSRELFATSEAQLESADEIAHALREIHNGQPREFADDPVMSHVAACVEELTRISQGL